MTGSAAPLDPSTFLRSLGEDLDALRRDGGYAAIVLHPAMLDWLGEDGLDEILTRAAGGAAAGELWVARCADVAEHVLARAGDFEGGTTLDATSWSG
jgi:hypothetical protein